MREHANVLQAQVTFQNDIIETVRKVLVNLGILVSNLADVTIKERAEPWNESNYSNAPFKTLSTPIIKSIEKEDCDVAYSHRCSGHRGILLCYENNKKHALSAKEVNHEAI